MAGLDQARIMVAGNDDAAFGIVNAVDHTRARLKFTTPGHSRLLGQASVIA